MRVEMASPWPERNPLYKRAREKSGRSDLNRRPFGPQPNALPGCATPRYSDRILREVLSDAPCEHTFDMSEADQPRRCSRCSESKPANEFGCHRKARGQRDTYCRASRSEVIPSYLSSTTWATKSSTSPTD